jgi:hypothetical protein
MHGVGIDEPLYKWFEMKVPKTSVDANFITNVLSDDSLQNYKPTTQLIFLGNSPSIETIIKSKKGNQWELASITFETKSTTINIRIDKAEGIWFYELLTQIKNGSKVNMKEVMENYESAGLEDFELFWDNKPMNQLQKAGLLMI